MQRSIHFTDSLDGILGAINTLQTEYMLTLNAKNPFTHNTVTPQKPRTPPLSIYMKKKLALQPQNGISRESKLQNFLESHCIHDDDFATRASVLRDSFNFETQSDETHVSFSRLMESSADHIKKSQRHNGIYYLGIRVNHDIPKLVTHDDHILDQMVHTEEIDLINN